MARDGQRRRRADSPGSRPLRALRPPGPKDVSDTAVCRKR